MKRLNLIRKIIAISILASTASYSHALMHSKTYLELCKDISFESDVELVKKNYPACWHYVEAIADIVSDGKVWCTGDSQILHMIASGVGALRSFKTDPKLWDQVKNKSAYFMFPELAWVAVEKRKCTPVGSLRFPRF